MKNLIFILIFLLGSLSNNAVFAVANKATYSETQIIRTIPKQKKLSYLEKVFTKKIAKSNSKFSEIMVSILGTIGAVIAIATELYIASLPFSALGLSLGFAILAGFILILVLTIIVLFIDTGGRIGGC